MEKRLEYNDDKTSKFWVGTVSGCSYTVKYGRTGTNGQEATTQFDTDEEALKKFEKVVKEKLKKGYFEV